LGGGESAEEGTEHLSRGCVVDEGGEGERVGAGVIRWDGMKDGREDRTTPNDIRYHGNNIPIYSPLVLMRSAVQCISYTFAKNNGTREINPTSQVRLTV